MEAILEASHKVDRALRAGALAVGAQGKIQTIPGYLPIRQSKEMADVFRANAVGLVGEENIGQVHHRTGSTDMGDVSQLMPVIHPYTGAATGPGHSIEYLIQDYQQAVINPAKAMAMSVIDLLAEGSAKAKAVLDDYTPVMTKDEYVTFQNSRLTEELYDGAE